MGDEIDGAMQQAPQPGRQASISNFTLNQAQMPVCIVRFYWAVGAFSATIRARFGRVSMQVKDPQHNFLIDPCFLHDSRLGHVIKA
jgi:hypothetical protein